MLPEIAKLAMANQVERVRALHAKDLRDGAVIMCTRAPSSGRCSTPSVRPASPSVLRAIPYGIPSPPIFWKMDTTSAPCRSFWVTRTSVRP